MIHQVEHAEPDAYRQYLTDLSESLGPFGGRLLAQPPHLLVDQGNWDPQLVVIFEFPDRESIHNWYDSERGLAMKAQRDSLGTSRMLLVDADAE